MAQILVIGSLANSLAAKLKALHHQCDAVADVAFGLGRLEQHTDIDLAILSADGDVPAILTQLDQQVGLTDSPVPILVAGSAEQLATIPTTFDIFCWQSDGDTASLIRCLSRVLNPAVTQDMQLTPKQIAQLNEQS